MNYKLLTNYNTNIGNNYKPPVTYEINEAATNHLGLHIHSYH